MIESITWLQWVNLLAVLALFMGPGFALLSFFPDKQSIGTTYTIILAFGLSIALWAILLAWFKLVGITLQPYSCALILASGWLVGLWRSRAGLTRANWGQMLKLDMNRSAIWLTAVVSLLIGLWGIRHQVVGLGSDSYHHTLIVQLITQNGGLPSNYLPYAPLATFSYHYGFHALVAALDWLTQGIAARLLVPVVFELLLAAVVLAVAFMAESATHSRTAGLVSAAVTGLVCVFPAFMGNWGRYTQLTGLILLALFLGLFWRWMEAGFKRQHLPWIAILAVGIALAHYRITLMALLAILALLGIYLATKRPAVFVFRQNLVSWLGAACLALCLGAPWLWLVISGRSRGFPVVISQSNDAGFSISRLGITVLQYPTNYLLLVLAAAALIWGWHKRDRLVIWLTVWEALMLALSRPNLLGDNMDTISVIISSFIPLAVLLGWLAAWFSEHPPVLWLQRLAVIAGVVVSLWGALTISHNIYIDNAMVREADLSALEWVRATTPPDALFMVNTYHWDFNAEYVIGTDAGYWLPLLAGRQTVTMPMIYSIERTTQAGLAQRLAVVDSLSGDLTSPVALDIMKQAGISYIFTGDRGGKIDISLLLASPSFELVYQQGKALVFKIKTSK